MRCIVTSWVYPREHGDNWVDERPKSIERISTSIEDLKSFMQNTALNGCFGDTIEWASNCSKFFYDEDVYNADVEMFYNNDGYAYLEEGLKEDGPLNQCFARVYYSRLDEDERDYHYFRFMIRNIH